MLVINEEQNYFRLKETIRAKDDLLSNIGQDSNKVKVPEEIRDKI